MSWQHFLTLAGAHFLALLSPGPDFFLLIHTALAYGRAASWLTALGIACANGVFIVAAIAGLTLLSDQPLAYALLYWGGCGYLGWLGWRFWQAAPAALAPAATVPHAARPGGLRHLAAGFGSGILNPKNALFYLTLFTMLAGQGSTQLARAGAGVWMFAVVLGWDCLIGRLFTRPAVVAVFERRQRLLHRGSACLMWGVVLALAWPGLTA